MNFKRIMSIAAAGALTFPIAVPVSAQSVGRAAAFPSTAPSAVEDPITFRFVQLASVEQSMAAVDAALKTAGYQAKVKTAQAQSFENGNVTMDRNGGAPVPWDEFYGKTDKDFYMRRSAEVQVTARRGGAYKEADAVVQGRAQLVKRPPQMDYIYRANSEQAAQARADAAALGGQIDKLLQRRHQLELQQAALWARIAAAIVDGLDTDQRALYGNELSSADAPGLPGATDQRAAAVQGLAGFVRVVVAASASMDQMVGKDQSAALRTLQENADRAQKDLSRSMSHVTDAKVAADVQPIAAQAKMIMVLSNNAVEAASTAAAADASGDDLQKATNRGLLQTALADFADKMTSLDAGIAQLAVTWKIQPIADKPLPDVTVSEAVPSQPIALPAPPAPAAPVSPIHASAAPPAPRSPAPQIASGPAMDLMSQIRLPADAVGGDWKQSGNGIETATTTAAKLRFPVKPASEYDVQISFTPTSDQTDFSLILHHAGRGFVWRQTNTVSGFAMVNRHIYSQNRSSTHHPNSPFVKGQSYTMVVSVRSDAVIAYLNGAQVRQLKTDYADLSLDRSHSLGPGENIGIECNSPLILSGIQYTPVNGG